MNNYNTERINKLRKTALAATVDYTEFYYYYHLHLCQSTSADTSVCRVADAFYHAFSQITVSVGEDELIVGKPVAFSPDSEQKKTWETLQKYTIPSQPAMLGQASHMAINFDTILNNGLYGIIESIENNQAVLDLTQSSDLEKESFYNACKKSLEAVILLSRRYAEKAKSLAENATEEYKIKELLKLAEICERVPAYPARTFHEAIQAVHFISYCLAYHPFRTGGDVQYQLGRPDRYLLKYYKQDIENKILTQGEAQALLDCLGIMINHRVPSGLSSGYLVGGRDENGKVVTGELTQMLMKVVENTRLVYPAVGLCCCDDTPREDIAAACEIVGKGCSHPAFFNDKVISKGLEYYGLSQEEACNYIHSTCVEITPVGCSNVWVASPYTNLVQVLLDVIEGEQAYTDIQEIINAFFARLSKSIRKNFIAENKQRIERQRQTVFPLLSCFVEDCLKQGLDIERGGARYNWIMPSFVGIANVADALTVMDTLIFKEKAFTFDTLKNMLKSDFKGYEELHNIILNKVEKYGNDSDEADKYVKCISEWISTECERYTPALQNARLIPSLFCWIMHECFGAETAASPDGRNAGFPLGDGSGPVQGRERKGPTASILSSTKWEHSKFIGGIAVNMKFSQSMFTEESQSNLLALVNTYLDRGGFELQINVTDTETLLKAQKNPEAYADLVVRIGGYSDYFIRLSKNMQAEVIARSVHVI